MEATVSRKRLKLGLEDDANVVELKSKRYGDGDVNVASTTSDLKAVCDSEAEADMFVSGNNGFRDEDVTTSDLKAVCDSEAEADMFVSGNNGFRDEDVTISGAVKRRKLSFEDKSRDGNFNENVASTTSFSNLKAVCVSVNDGFRDTSTSSVVCFESEEMESSSTTEIEASSCRKLPPVTVVTMPSEAELEEFFAEAEKYEQKRFAEKYNFDIKKDVPMEGRYQWVQLNP